MNRRRFLKSAAIASVMAVPTIPAVAASVVPVKKSIRIFQAWEHITIIVCNQTLKCRYPVSCTTHEALEAVQEFLKGKPDFEYLLNNGPKVGCKYYWEESRYHDEYPKELIAMFPKIPQSDLRCALYIYENKLQEMS